jgi:adhesin HecA-like repeat protein
MASYSWILGSGDWKDPSKWTPSGGPPKPTDSATITATGPSYTVTVGTPDVANSLTLSSSSATLNDTASLTIDGALALSAGALNVNSAGVLTVNGLLSLSGGSLNVNSGATAASLTQTGGTIGGTGKLTVSGAATFSGGAFGIQTGNRNDAA